MQIKRVGAWKYLSAIYAPDGKRGKYFVCSQVATYFSGYLTVTGHVIKQGGKLRRVWIY
jgi:hypothetical protein